MEKCLTNLIQSNLPCLGSVGPKGIHIIKLKNALPKTLTEIHQFGFCLAEQLGKNNSLVEFIEIYSAATAYMHSL